MLQPVFVGSQLLANHLASLYVQIVDLLLPYPGEATLGGPARAVTAFDVAGAGLRVEETTPTEYAYGVASQPEERNGDDGLSLQQGPEGADADAVSK